MMPRRTPQEARTAAVESSSGRPLNARVLAELRSTLLQAVAPGPNDRAVDLAAKTGFLTFAVAGSTAQVLAIDQVPRTVRSLVEEASRRGLDNVEAMAQDLWAVDLAPASVDLVVSDDALPQLSDRERRAMVARARRWLSPNGRLAIGDVKLGRWDAGVDRGFVHCALGRPPRNELSRLWRSADRHLHRLSRRAARARPSSPRFWVDAMRAAGFEAVVFDPVDLEAGVVSGRVPA